MRSHTGLGYLRPKHLLRLATTVMAVAAVLSQTAHAAGKAASFVVDANTGTVISAYNADEPRYPASLTKMMTLYIVFDLIEQGRLNYQTKITMSEKATSAPPSKLGLETGSEIALIDAIKALVTRSANDVAVAIAEHIAGSEEKFAALMTQRARMIGMKASTFRNASGLPNDEQVTTARDMVTLGLRLHDDFPKHYALFALREFRYAGHLHPNHNTMLNSYEGTEGIKTGYTQSSGFNLVASVKRNSKHVVGAVFGGASAASRNQTMRTLLNLALYKASPTKTRTPTVALARAKPVPEPHPVHRTATRDVGAGTKPRPESAPWSPTVAEAKPLPTSKPNQPDGAATAPPGTGNTIEMARVRPVLLAPRTHHRAAQQPSPQATASNSAATAPIAPAPVDFRLPPIAASASPETPTPNVAPAHAGSAPTGLGSTRGATKVAESTPTAPNLAPSPARGKSPSSLQQQAANLSASSPGSAYHLSGPATGSATSLEIQVGAYSSATEAERQLSLVRSKAGDVIGAAQSVTQPIVANGKSMWRARFHGVPAASAATVCDELRRRQIDCLVARAE